MCYNLLNKIISFLFGFDERRYNISTNFDKYILKSSHLIDKYLINNTFLLISHKGNEFDFIKVYDYDFIYDKNRQNFIGFTIFFYYVSDIKEWNYTTYKAIVYNENISFEKKEIIVSGKIRKTVESGLGY